MIDLNELLEQDAAKIVVSETDLAAVAALAEEQIAAEDEVAKCEKALAVAKKSLELIQITQLPELMNRIGMTEFKLRDGRTVSIKSETYVSVSEERQERAYAWLREHGEAGVIKNVVSVSFGKDQDEAAQELLEKLAELKYAAEQNENVHHSTLKALIRRRIENGHEVDMELFGVHQVNKAMVA